ncbi:MAG TPA: hypothetical protein LFV92_05475 [Rickettsia endosymbiont of Ceroptres masudai]|nr:hypothetical protein [Rickettsia endosymbiont of Ceroptres masudai]
MTKNWIPAFAGRLCCMDTQIVIARSEATWQSRKIIKKFCKSEFFYSLLRQNLQFFLAMTAFSIHATMLS